MSEESNNNQKKSNQLTVLAATVDGNPSITAKQVQYEKEHRHRTRRLQCCVAMTANRC
jgi:hypothetical protein